MGAMVKNTSSVPFLSSRRPAPDRCAMDKNQVTPFRHSLPPEKPGGRIVRDSFNIRIDRNGVWYYEGSPINRKSLVCLFASALMRDENGDYWLVTPAEMGRIDVEDAPFIAVELYVGGEGRDQVLSVRTNVDEIVTIDKDHPITIVTDGKTGEPSPYVTLRHGIEARLSRPVYYELASLGVERRCDGAHIFGVWSRGSFFSLGSTET
jgi:uncharacterized protein